MEKITSFCIDHDILGKGLYVSRIDGEVITYDMRMVVPNAGVYLENAGLHTFEHLLATFVRNSSFSDQMIYVGPMGCRTGFYFLTRTSMTKEDTINLLQEAMAFIQTFEGDIPGAQYPKECGNYLDHNLAQARTYAKAYSMVIQDWTPLKMDYPTK